MKNIMIILALIILSVTAPAFAGPNYVYGNLNGYSTVPGGLLIMVDTGIPDNCAGTPYGWMIIAEEDKAMLSVALMRINQDLMGVGIYSAGVFYQGFCRAIQLQPVGF